MKKREDADGEPSGAAPDRLDPGRLDIAVADEQTPSDADRGAFGARSVRRKAAVAAALSFLVWSCWFVTRPNPHPYRDLSGGAFTDHFSHMNAARAFPVVGREIWTRPFAALFRSMTPAELAALPDDVRAAAGPEVRFVPGWPDGKPFVASWSHNARLYPPGDMLLVAPVALAYHLTPLSFAGANTLLILLFLLYAHVALYVVFVWAQEERWSGFAFLPLFILYGEVIHWTLEGFYDAAVIAPLVLCARYLGARRGLAAVLAFCVASVIHFRALFFAPWVVWGAVLALRERPWRTWTRRDAVAAGAAAILGVATLYVFYLLYPTLRSLPVNNALAQGHRSPALVTFAAVTLVVAVMLARARAWLDLATVGWTAFMLVQLREAYPWHVVAVLPLLLGAGSSQMPSAAREARAVYFIAFAVIIFRNTTVPFWIGQLW